MEIVLDTSVVVAHLRRQTNLFAVNSGVETLFLPLVALGELYKGAEKSSQPQVQYALLEKLMQERFELLGPGEVTARFYAQIASNLERSGVPIPQNDLWIAASALETNLPLATRDAHFARVPDLTVLRW